MTRTITRLLLVFASVLLVACSSVPRKTAAPAPPLPLIPPPDLTGATLFGVDSQQSALHVHVFRGGAMAHLGHNHVVSAAPLHGSVWIHPQVERSGFDVTFAVNGMIVDDPAARLAAGEEFASAVPAASREGTRRNMLRAEVLDGARYPEISLRSVSVSGPLSSPAVMARVTIRAVSRDVPVPAHVSLAGETLVVTGGLDLLQSDFGITPYSVALGALQVQDRLHVTYRIVAVRQPQR